MKWTSSRAMLAIVSCTVAIACNDVVDPSGVRRVPGAPKPKFNLEVASANAIRAAQTGQSQRGEEDYMLRFEARYPGFGGYYVDSVGDLVLVLRDPARYRAEDLRAQLDADYAARDVASIREVWRSLGKTRVQKGDFSLSELVGIQSAISRSSSPIPGKVGVGTQIHTNKILVDFSSDASAVLGLAAIRAQGIADAAIKVGVTGPIQLTGTWTDKFRPTFGGPLITVHDAAIRGDSLYTGTHGFNVSTRPPFVSVTFFMTAAHVVSQWSSTNGQVGWSVLQAIPADTMGTIVVNPPYDTTGCDADSTGTASFYCTTADVTLGSRKATVTPSFGVGTSTTEGLNGAVGSNTINGVYAVVSIITASQVPVTRNLVHKSGYRTGTTTGAVISTCYNAFTSLSFVTGIRSFEVKCQVVLDHIGFGTGDSGSPVFARLVEGGSYYALGIQFAGAGPIGPTGICNTSTCRMIFSPWNAIESRTGYLLSPAP